MAYIAAVDGDSDLDREQEAVFELARNRFSFVPDVVRVLALRPRVARAQSELRDSLLDDSTLGRRRAELISLAVSGINNCAYCGTAHAGTMVARGDLSAEQAAQAFKDWRGLDLPEEDCAMLAFAEKLTFEPARIGEDDVQRLREAGFDDLGIYDIVLVAAYRNFINRVNDGLGVSTDKLRDRFGADIAERIADAL